MRVFAILVGLAFLSVPAQAFEMGLSGGEVAGGLALAAAVQKAVENGQYAFVAVIVLMFGLQVAKIVFGRRSKSVRRNAAQYSAIGGTAVGAAMTSLTGGDPVEGAVGGLMVGNAASGLYSSIAKPLGALGKKYLEGR